MVALWLFQGPMLAESGADWQLTTVAGSDAAGDGGRATAAQMAQPEGLVVDRAGNVYIADAANHRVRKVTAAGAISTVAGNGHPGFSGDGGPSVAAQLNQPYGLAMDAAGNLYIADFGNQRVRRIGADGIIETVAGNGERGSAGEGIAARSAQLLGPRNVALDGAGNLYLSEFDGHRVRRVSADGTIATFAGTGMAGLSGDGGPALAAQLNSPAGLAVDGAGTLYIVDTANLRIRSVCGGIIETVCDRRRFAAPYIRFSGIAADSGGRIYFPESANSFVWLYGADGTLTRVAGAPGSGTYTGDEKPAAQTALNKPVDVTLDAAGNLYISEFRRVRRLNARDGTLTTAAGDGTFGFGGDGGSAREATFAGPAGIAVRNGEIYAADQGNHRIRKISGSSISTVAGNGEADYAGDGLPATTASLNQPTGVAFDSDGNLYIADSYNSRVRRVDAAGTIITVAGNGQSAGFGAEGGLAVSTPLSNPKGVAAGGSLFIADTGENRVIRVNADGTMNTIAGTGSPGFTGDGDATSLWQLNWPSGLAVDVSGTLFIADTLNNRVRKLTADGMLTTFAGNGARGSGGDGGDALSAELDGPCAVAVDADGEVFIADGGNNRVRMVTADGKITTIAGTGDPGYNGEEGPALEMSIAGPCGLAVDGEGNVLVADTGNNRIRKLIRGSASVPPPASIARLANAASMRTGPLAPGEIFAIFGEGIGPEEGTSGTLDDSGALPVSLGDVQVLFDGVPAPLFYVQSKQINAQAPYEIAGRDSIQVVITYKGLRAAEMTVPLAEADPALFTVNYGTGQAAALNQDGTVNSPENPAPRGSVVVLYGTGEGQTSPGEQTGRATESPWLLPLLPVSVTIAGVPCEVLYAGSAPGFVGLMQINARIPSGFVPAGPLPVVIRAGAHQSPDGVTISAR